MKQNMLAPLTPIVSSRLGKQQQKNDLLIQQERRQSSIKQQEITSQKSLKSLKPNKQDKYLNFIQIKELGNNWQDGQKTQRQTQSISNIDYAKLRQLSSVTATQEDTESEYEIDMDLLTDLIGDIFD
ncbi:Hypothetical_protein [Hexamita inflata]|uniref:Hypothetical_protein n=1 Tax=Hexamita inflata TaxID=28002 RepID=A0ABP1GM43_9EUKA